VIRKRRAQIYEFEVHSTLEIPKEALGHTPVLVTVFMGEATEYANNMGNAVTER
jgi:hypothetical protein